MYYVMSFIKNLAQFAKVNLMLQPNQIVIPSLMLWLENGEELIF